LTTGTTRVDGRRCWPSAQSDSSMFRRAGGHPRWGGLARCSFDARGL